MSEQTTAPTEREELAEVVCEALEKGPGIYDTSWREDCAMADVILAAGYRKPRTITTVEELDEAILSAFEDAAHMVLSDSKGRPWIIWSDEDGDEVVNSWPQEGDPKRLTLGNIALPATVLSHPALGGGA